MKIKFTEYELSLSYFLEPNLVLSLDSGLVFRGPELCPFPPLITECVRMDRLLSWLQEVTSPYDPVQDLTARIPAGAHARYATWQVLPDPGV